jgi:hypothetical protein
VSGRKSLADRLFERYRLRAARKAWPGVQERWAAERARERAEREERERLVRELSEDAERE